MAATFQRGPSGTIIAGLRLTDGGVYDNLGLEPIWKTHAVVLVSDAGALFNFEADRNLLWRIRRYTQVVENQAGAVRKRWLISNFLAEVLAGTYWGIGRAVTSYDPVATHGYSKALAKKIIARIRTDMDAFSDAEAAVLENHGYTLADAAVNRHVPSLLPVPIPPLMVPDEAWMAEGKVQEALKNSGRRTILGRW